MDCFVNVPYNSQKMSVRRNVISYTYARMHRIESRAIMPTQIPSKDELHPNFGADIQEGLFSTDVSSYSQDSDLEDIETDPSKHLADLRANWENWIEIHFPAVVSAMEDLTHKSAAVRKAAVMQLLKSATPEENNTTMVDHHVRAVTTALAGRLGDGSAGVREAAVRGLSCLSIRSSAGSERRRLVLAMADLAEEETAVTVRRAAVQALARIADRGDTEALAPVLRLLRRSDGHCRGDHFSPHLSPALSRHAARAYPT